MENNNLKNTVDQLKKLLSHMIESSEKMEVQFETLLALTEVRLKIRQLLEKHHL